MIYLDNSATSFFKPRSVKRAVSKALNNPVNIGRTASGEAFKLSRRIYEARETICDFIGAKEPENIIFTKNATEALNFAFKGIVKDTKAHIVTTYMEHNSILRQIYSNENISCSFVPCRKDYIVDIYKIPYLIKEDTKLIVLNCGSNVTGNFIDWKEAYKIVQKFKIPVLFDFSQVVGNIPIDLYGCDNCMAAFSGHKSLLGPQGTGVLYVSPDIMLKTIFEGGTGSMSNELIQPEFYPDRLETGTLNTPGILGLLEGVKFVNKKTVSEIYNHKISLCSYLYERLLNMDKIKLYHDGRFNNKLPIISFNVGEIYSDEITSILSKDYNISLRGGYHCAPFCHKIMGTEFQGAIRVSPGYNTKKSEIIKFVDILNKIVKKQFQNKPF